MLKVAVAGVCGRMGRLTLEALGQTAGVSYAGGFARAARPQDQIFDSLDELFGHGRPDVLVDFTVHPKTVEVATAALRAGVRPVIGATGWSESEISALEKLSAQEQLGAMLVPNFAIGAVLMMRFAREAARFFPTAEIIEMHHDTKRDKPSGTAKLTSEGMRSETGRDTPIHSMRLRGLVAHQEVLLGNTGEVLTIRHDSISRESFAAGIVMAILRVASLSSLEVGLDASLREQEAQ